MTKPKIQVGDVVREMTQAEFTQYELDKIENVELNNQVLARAQAKLALLERLGITEEEAKLLLG